MLLRVAGVLHLGVVAFATSVVAQPMTPPVAITRTVIATTKLPTVTDLPLYFRAVGVTVPPGEKINISAPDGILFQLSGSTEVSVDGQPKALRNL
jgi:hypothetical protein